MKKLIIGAAMAFAATFANAAAVNWLAEGVPMANAVVLFYSAENSGNTLADMIKALGTDGDKTVLTGWEFATVADGTDAYSDEAKGSYAKSSNNNFYALVLNVDDMSDISKATKFAYYDNQLTYVPDNDPETIDVSFASPSAFTDIATVPEPTSGLLLLLGVAGLALRRRRA